MSCLIFIAGMAAGVVVGIVGLTLFVMYEWFN